MLGKIFNSGLVAIVLSVVYSNFAFAVVSLNISTTAVNATKLPPVSVSPNAGACFNQAANLMNEYVNSVNSCVTGAVNTYNSAITAATNAYNAATANNPGPFAMNQAMTAFTQAVNNALSGTGCSYTSQSEAQLTQCFLTAKNNSCRTANAGKLGQANTKRVECCTSTQSQVTANSGQISSLNTSITGLNKSISSKQAQISALQAQIVTLNGEVSALNGQKNTQQTQLNTLMTNNAALNALLSANSCASPASPIDAAIKRI
jgi:hypothetical protein